MKKILAVYFSFSLLLLTSYTTTALANYAYISNSAGNSVTVCEDGGASLGLTNCDDSGVGSSFVVPAGITIPDQTFSGNNYAYVANTYAASVSKCLINTSDGTFTSCSDSGAGSIFLNVRDVAFKLADVDELYAYVTIKEGEVIRCDVDLLTGDFDDESCENEIAPLLSAPVGVTIQTVNSTDYAYIPNSDSGTITQCAVTYVNGNAMLTPCNDSGVGAEFTSPQNIAFHTATDLFAYVTDSTFDTTGAIWKCDVDATEGTLSNCNTTGYNVDLPSGITFKTINSNTHAYITNMGNGEYTQCTINGSNGELTCTSSEFPEITYDSVGLTYFSVNGVKYLYMANAGAILQCKINEETGKLQCIDSGAGFISNNPFSINLYEFSSNIYAYIVDPTDAVALVCPVDSTTGQFMAPCADYGSGTFSNPQALTIGSVNSNTYAYVSDKGPDTDGTVWQCDVNTSTGALSACADAGYGANGEAAGIWFNTFNGNDYVYVVSAYTSSILKCSVNSSSGSFDSCADSGVADALNYPNAIWMQQIDSNFFAYIPDVQPLGGTQYIKRFPVDPLTGDFSTGTNIHTGINGQEGIAFAPGDDALYVYLTDAANDRIIQCEVNSSGNLSSCANSLLPPGNPVNIALYSHSPTANYAYVTQDSGTMITCLVDRTTGLLSNLCTDAGTAFTITDPTAITFKTLDTTTYAYITDAATNSVVQCTWDAVGYLGMPVLTSCTSSNGGGTFDAPAGIAFEEVDNNLYAYITNKEGDTATWCTVDTGNGELLTCFPSILTLADPYGMTFVGDYGYISDSSSGQVLICDPDENALSCVDSGAGATFASPIKTTFFTDSEDDLNVYVTNLASNSIKMCAVNTGTGLLSGCGDSGAGAVFAQPGVAAFGADDFVYVTNTQAANNTVSRCSVLSDGTLDTCEDSGAGDIFARPFVITFFSP